MSNIINHERKHTHAATFNQSICPSSSSKKYCMVVHNDPNSQPSSSRIGAIIMTHRDALDKWCIGGVVVVLVAVIDTLVTGRGAPAQCFCIIGTMIGISIAAIAVVTAAAGDIIAVCCRIASSLPFPPLPVSTSSSTFPIDNTVPSSSATTTSTTAPVPAVAGLAGVVEMGKRRSRIVRRGQEEE
jgi:hypothetical protein